MGLACRHFDSFDACSLMVRVPDWPSGLFLIFVEFVSSSIEDTAKHGLGVPTTPATGDFKGVPSPQAGVMVPNRGVLGPLFAQLAATFARAAPYKNPTNPTIAA
jgi:hypothetical protein